MSDSHPLTLDYYLSYPVNAYADDNNITQEDVNEQCEFEFKQDSITKTIGTDQCKFNIDLFWNEVFSSFYNQDQMRHFLIKIMNKLINEYNLELLKQYTSNYFDIDNFKEEAKRILEFFETSHCSRVFGAMFYSKSFYDIINNKDELKEYLETYYEFAIQKLPKLKNDIPAWLYYIFSMMPKEDFVDLAMKIFDRYTTETLTEILTIRGTRNVQN
jgi:hypothetical protein